MNLASMTDTIQWRFPRHWSLAMDMTLLTISLVFGLIGMGMFTYGKRQQHVVCLVSGLALMVFPYFVPSAIIMVIVGTLLTFAPYFIVL